MSDDPYGNLMPTLLPLSAAIPLLAALFLLGALCALCESTLRSANIARAEKDAEAGSRAAKRFLSCAKDGDIFLSPLQFGVGVCGFLSMAISLLGFLPPLSALLGHTGESSLSAVLPAAGILLLATIPLYFILADLMPKKLAAHRAVHAQESCYRLAGLIRILQTVFWPLSWFCDAVSNGILRLLGKDPQKVDDAVTEEELLHLMGEGEENGVIEENELDMITNILEFNDTTVSEIMTHRTDICALEVNEAISAVSENSVTEGFSRLPVYRDDIDTIIGICYVKDFLPYIGKPVPEFIQLKDMLRPAYFVPETKKCSQLFKELQERRLQIAVVVDEYGGTAGIVTLEDLVESILGNIQDEYDHEQEEIQQVNENTFTVDGTASIDEISDLTGVSLPEGDYDTIAGLVTQQIGRIPKEDEHPVVDICGLTITVEVVEDNRLARLLIVKNPEPTEEDEADED